MNLFVLDNNLQKNAEYHVDKHIVKMVLEAAQIACTVRRLKGDDTPAYKATHIHHPCVQWAGEVNENYVWVCNYGLELCKEYTFRYGRIHGCQSILHDCLYYQPGIRRGCQTPHVLAMPTYCMRASAIESYREYYNREKRHLFAWKNREQPDWIIV